MDQGRRLEHRSRLRFWRLMAADASAFDAEDFLSLLENIAKQPECAGLIQQGRLLPAGWHKELDELFAVLVVRDDSATLLAGLARLEEPLHGGLAYALASSCWRPTSFRRGCWSRPPPSCAG